MLYSASLRETGSSRQSVASLSKDQNKVPVLNHVSVVSCWRWIHQQDPVSLPPKKVILSRNFWAIHALTELDVSIFSDVAFCSAHWERYRPSTEPVCMVNVHMSCCLWSASGQIADVLADDEGMPCICSTIIDYFGKTERRVQVATVSKTFSPEISGVY